MTELQNILEKYGFPKRTNTSSVDIKLIEKQIGFSLPDDYLFYLTNYQGHEEFVGPELVTLWDFDELLATNEQTGIFKNLPLTLGIGNNPSSEFIAIQYTPDSKYRIVLSPFIDLDKQYHIEIGSSFTDFFIRLENGKEWF